MHRIIFMHPESGTETTQQHKKNLATGARKPDFRISNQNLEYDCSQSYGHQENLMRSLQEIFFKALRK
jgi:hypothetical protein